MEIALLNSWIRIHTANSLNNKDKARELIIEHVETFHESCHRQMVDKHRQFLENLSSKESMLFIQRCRETMNSLRWRFDSVEA